MTFHVHAGWTGDLASGQVIWRAGIQAGEWAAGQAKWVCILAGRQMGKRVKDERDGWQTNVGTNVFWFLILILQNNSLFNFMFNIF